MARAGNFRRSTFSPRPLWAWLLPLFLLTLFPSGLPSMDISRGDTPVAELYAQWTRNLIEDGLWSEALFALERAADFADVSSDISYLLALARSHEKKDRAGVLEAVETALAVDSWNLYDAEAARLLKIEHLIALRAYEDALAELSLAAKSLDEAALTLKVLAAFRPADFRARAAETFSRYPRASEPARIFFRFLAANDAAGRNPEKGDLDLLELLIRRLPLFLSDDPELAWMAAPFMRDTEEAARFVSAYRAVNIPAPASLPAALRLGIIDEETALEELFGGEARNENVLAPVKTLDLLLLGDIWELLRREEAKDLFKRNLSAFTGVIKEDVDRDGISETSAEYIEGMLTASSYDPAQRGVDSLTVYYEGGDPKRAFVLVPPENPGELFLGGESPRPPAKSAKILSERYPSILEAELDGARYIPRPLEFFYQPVRFIELWGSLALFPQWDPLTPALTRRVLVFNSLRVERPSLEFSGATEIVDLNEGIPIRAREYAEGLMVSETEFLRGRPQLQRVDLDFDGHWDTARFFRRNYRPVELEELWEYDRDFERVENYQDGYES